MSLFYFTSTPDAQSTLDATSETLTVGATLNVEPDQAAGTYEGTFDVTVQYN